MPSNKYECMNCGHMFDILRGVTESDSRIICPKCGAKKPRRIFSPFNMGASKGSCTPRGGG